MSTEAGGPITVVEVMMTDQDEGGRGDERWLGSEYIVIPRYPSGIGSRKPPQKPKSADAQVPYVG